MSEFVKKIACDHVVASCLCDTCNLYCECKVSELLFGDGDTFNCFKCKTVLLYNEDILRDLFIEMFIK